MQKFMKPIGYIITDEDTKSYLRVNGSWKHRDFEVTERGYMVRVYDNPTVACRVACSYKWVRTAPKVLYHNEEVGRKHLKVVEWAGDYPLPDQKHWHDVFTKFEDAKIAATNLYNYMKDSYVGQTVEGLGYHVAVQNDDGELLAVVCKLGLLEPTMTTIWDKYVNNSTIEQMQTKVAGKTLGE